MIDEAQYGQDAEGLSHQAFASVYQSSTVLISGTFIKNRWSSVHSFIDLLPGHPFGDKKAFENAFGLFNQTLQQRTQFHRLAKFLMAFTLSRPAHILKIPESLVTRLKFPITMMRRPCRHYGISSGTMQ